MCRLFVCRGAARESLHGDKLKRKQRELRSWAEGAASLHVLKQLDTGLDQFLLVCAACLVLASADAMQEATLAQCTSGMCCHDNCFDDSPGC